MNDFKVGDLCEVIDNCYWKGRIIKLTNINNFFYIGNLVDGEKYPLYFQKRDLRLLKETKQIFSDIDPYGEEDWGEET